MRRAAGRDRLSRGHSSALLLADNSKGGAQSSPICVS